MTDPVVLAVAAIAILALGLAGGWFIGVRSSSDNRRSRELEHKLDQILQEKKAYESEVTEHFSETARLLNNLTRSYSDVHGHLANGAANLCPGQGPLPLQNSTDPDEIPPALAVAQPPLDYAPKSSPEEQGMLSEDFGLDKSELPGIDGAPDDLASAQAAPARS